MYVKQKRPTYPTQSEEFKMPQINLTIEEHQALTNHLADAYGGNYRSNLMDTDTFDSMADKCFDAVNNLLVEDF